MDAFFTRADQADEVLKKLTDRVASLESRKKSAVPAAGNNDVGMHVDVAAYVKKEVTEMRKALLGYEKTIAKQAKQIENLKKQLAKSKSAPAAAPASSGTIEKEQFTALRERVAGLRPKIAALEQENADLKARLEQGSSSIPTELTSNEVEYIKNKVLEIRAKVEAELGASKSAPAAAPQSSAATSSSLVKQTMDTIKERKMYFVTEDLVELKKEWYEAELGELDDEDFQLYLGREVKSIDVEEDDDTVNVRFDSSDTQWFPVGCLYKKIEGAPAAAATKPVAAAASKMTTSLVKQTMDTIKERKMYFVTEDLVELKKEWYEAELGELDDEDFQLYLGREVKSIDVEEDDDTVNVRFDSSDTQWFPVGCLYKKVEGAAPTTKKVASMNAGLTKQTMDTIKERKNYFVTEDLVELKKEWYEAELGELDDEDFQLYLGRDVKSIDIEEDDDTVNVRFDSSDTQWFPVGCLYKA